MYQKLLAEGFTTKLAVQLSKIEYEYERRKRLTWLIKHESTVDKNKLN